MLDGVIRFPWGRAILLIGLCYLGLTLIERHSFCQAKVEADLADVQFLAESCSIDKRFSRAYDCEAYGRKLEPDYANEAWWDCFWNSFYFYRSWIRIVALPALAAIAYKVWKLFEDRPGGTVHYIETYAPSRALDYVPRRLSHHRRPVARLRYYDSDEGSASD
jgi:hypothetical protein